MSIVHVPNILLAIPRNPVTALGLPLALGFLSGSPASKEANSKWYHSLPSPPLRPSREVFPFVWSSLYLVCEAMGCASHIAVKSLDSAEYILDRNDLSLGLALYYGQLGLNYLWSPLFFEGKRITLALLDSILLTGTTFYMTKLFHRPTNAKTTYLLLPYCAWLSYATYLNVGMWQLTRDTRK